MIGLMARPLEKYFFGFPEAGEINVISTGGGVNQVHYEWHFVPLFWLQIGVNELAKP